MNNNIQEYSGAEENLVFVEEFEAILKDKFPFMSGVVEKGRLNFGKLWETEFAEALARMFSTNKNLSDAVRGYVDFSIDAMRLQKAFEKELEYRSKSYEEASADVYHNDEYMNNLYLPGIFLSHFLWPHHYRQYLFCRSTFLNDMRLANSDVFYDVGVGTGFFSRLALQVVPEVRGRGFDISVASKQYAERQAESFGVSSRYSVELRDVVKEPPDEKVMFLMSVEILEHLEDPLAFLKALRQMLAPGGKAFITAALNAANADHIFLYRTPSEVKKQLNEAGFTIEQYHSSMAYAPPAEGIPVPEIVAFVVT